ncbi:glycosyltransferase [Pseudonocardia hispaniensis]|uniref:Glycosyltransferase n=1 Tax=Pseudonocardia hispaniensis TaxID=904933 RepID=A0ABW1IYM8_9PSEU
MSAHPAAHDLRTASGSLPTGGRRAHDLSVVVPTFNEAENIDELMGQLSAALPADLSAEVIFVDDSTDDTPAVIAAAAERHPVPVTLLHRPEAVGGLGGAVVEGLRAARSPWAVVMDADLQHPPSLVPTLLTQARASGADLVVASRYAPGGSSAGLDGRYRQAVSRASTAVAARVLGAPVRTLTDPMSGFFAVRTAALRLDDARPLGYKVLLELIVRSGLTRVAEVPYRFRARHAGTSKSTLREGVRYLRHLAALRQAQRHTPAVDEPAEGELRPARSVPRRERRVVSLRERRPEAAPRLDVLVITSEAPPIVSGISRCVDRLSTGLRERGHRVDVLSSVQIPRFEAGEFRLSALAAHWPGIARRLDDYDVINLHGPVPSMSDLVLLMAGRRRNTPIVYTHHSALAVRGAERLSAVYNRIHRLLSGRADMILTTSEHYAQWERRPGGPPVRVVPWGVDLRSQPLRPRTDRPLQVLFVGQMRPYKGLEWLLPAVAGRPDIELTLVGDGQHRRDYERLAAELGASNVRFLGRVPDEVLHREYDRNDVVVLPSVTQAEAFGLVVLEGMAAGCVPVVSDLPGVRDLVAGVGTVVPRRDEAALRAALLDLAADRARLRRRGRLARRRAKGLGWDTCVDRYEDALFDAVAQRGRPARRARRTAAAPSLNPVLSGPGLRDEETG